MTNYEKHKSEIEKFARMGLKVAVKKDTNEIVSCIDVGSGCDNCLFGGYGNCAQKSMAWADAEYIESEVDWSKVAVDTPILVSDDNEYWYRSYFAKYDNNDHQVWTWRSGRTSWSINYDGAYLVSNKETWKYAKLADA